MGGYFAGFVLTKKLAKTTYLQLPFVYVVLVLHRALRILPSYAAGIFFDWKIIPWWLNSLKNIRDNNCDRTWWHNLLFIDNYNTFMNPRDDDE